MNNALTKIEDRTIVTSVATREKSLQILRASRRPSFIGALAPSLLAIVLVGIGLSGFQLALVPKVIISVACMLSFASVAFAWQTQRQLLAIIDLLLLNEEQKH